MAVVAFRTKSGRVVSFTTRSSAKRPNPRPKATRRATRRDRKGRFVKGRRR